ncbi:MAG TPA: hypothetical protein VHD61_02355 [Lacunisphaera sp.]|nr:hypothetical protein [Lacunisphaera sp.]
MNPRIWTFSVARIPATLPICLLLSASLAVPARSTTIEPSAKPYTLFMGSDLSVARGKDFYKVFDVSGTSFIVVIGGTQTPISMLGGTHDLKVAPTLKLSDVSASVTGFKCERAYTPGNDPVMQRQRKSLEASAAIGDEASLAEGQALANANGGFVVGNIPPQATTASQASQDAVDAQRAYQTALANGVTGPALGALNAAAGTATANAANLTSAEAATSIQHMDADRLNSAVADSAFARLHAEEDRAREQFDAVSADFEISSATPLKKPFVVLTVLYRENPEDRGTLRSLIYARALDEIGPRPQRIHILKGGLPPGYQLEKYEIHFYDSGREIASDVAPKRVALSRDDAFEYMKIEYFNEHKGETLSAAPAIGKPERKAGTALTPRQRGEVYFVKVSKDGMPLEAFTDEACSQPVADSIGAVVQGVRFYPALEKGKPVDGIARLVLSHLEI